ncbi:hypothetical protein Ddye_029161 [Dipteronia dyeriana]|uniref:RNase H type-1 domain-containing protein n=1 Tax=Dipteronia dyeriana TaxID=168575 RepID=A0AAD9TF12_9ROSI|nr:hypothetical protein Ddye_029161 [Dipteronia dyeriana]
MILSLPCPSSFVVDSLIWHFDRLGSFFVKFGYHVGCSDWLYHGSSGVGGKGCKVGIGIIIRDSSGNVKVSSAQSFQAGLTTPIAKAMAIKRGLILALEIGLFPCVVDSDAQSVVKLISLPDIPCAEIGIIIKDIKLLLETSPGCVIGFARRSTNMATHGLAKLGLSVDSDMVWMEDYPHVLAPTILGDCPALS